MKKLVTRSFRLTEKADQALIADAKRQGISVGTLIGKILDRYMTFIRVGDDFGEIRVSSRTMKSLVDCIAEKELAEIGNSMGQSTPKLALMSHGRPFDFDNCLYFFSDFLGGYCKWYEGSIINEKSTMSFLMYDKFRMGEKWLIFVGNYASAMFQSILKTKVETNFASDHVTIKIPSVHAAKFSKQHPVDEKTSI